MKKVETPRDIKTQVCLVNELKENFPRFMNPPFWVKKPTPQDIKEYMLIYQSERSNLFVMAQKHVGCSVINSVSVKCIEYTEDDPTDKDKPTQ